MHTIYESSILLKTAATAAHKTMPPSLLPPVSALGKIPGSVNRKKNGNLLRGKCSMSRVGLNPTPKTDEDGDDGDGYNDKDEMNRHMKMQVKMKLRPNRNEVESQNSNCEEIPTTLNLKISRPTPLI